MSRAGRGSGRQRRKRYRSKGEQNAKKAQAWVIGGIALAVIPIIYLVFRDPPGPHVSLSERLQILSLCEDQSPSYVGESIIIVDASDSWSAYRRQVVENQVLEQVGIHRKVSVYKVQSGVTEESVVEPLITLCNPGDWDLFADTYGTPWGAVRQILDPKYRVFKDSILAVIDSVAVQPSIDNSPIMETLRWAAAGVSEDNLEVFLISDLLQNSNEYSMYQGNPDLSETRATDLAREERLGTEDLEGARVFLYMLLNAYPAGVNRDGLMRFWTHYLEKQGQGQVFPGQGASVVSVDPIP